MLRELCNYAVGVNVGPIKCIARYPLGRACITSKNHLAACKGTREDDGRKDPNYFRYVIRLCIHDCTAIERPHLQPRYDGYIIFNLETTIESTA